MGNYISSHWQDRVKKARSDAIDRQLKEDSSKLRKERKILLLGSSLPPSFGPSLSNANASLVLGSGESGKSTIIKQIKILHQGGFTNDELMAYRPTIYQNTLDSAQAIVLAMRKLGLHYVDPNNRVCYTLSTSVSLGLHPHHPGQCAKYI